MSVKVLVVDDEPQIRKQLKIGLEGYGYQVLLAASGEEAITQTAQQQPDMLILDISLGSRPDGLEVCQSIREWSKVPIIILSVHGEDKTKVEALHMGADDYLTKPFSMRELEARIQAVLRRISINPATNAQAEIEVGDLYVNLASRIVKIRGEEVHLTPTEYDLLHLLITHQGKVLTHHTILVKIWGEEYSSMNNYVRVFINQLRNKLQENPARNIRYIINEPGVGYRFIDHE